MNEKPDIENHKIMSMEKEKRDRILNAVMVEFCKGYKAASTDVVVREAGVSKGLLFHYFGTKQGLYNFTVWYALDRITKDFYDLINTKQSDYIDRLWQMILLKKDLSYRHPTIFEFLTTAYVNAKEDPDNDFTICFNTMRENVLGKLYDNVDTSLFREDVDVKMAFNTIYWTLTGYSEAEIKNGEKIEYYYKEYDRYLTDVKNYCNMFRKLFYK